MHTYVYVKIPRGRSDCLNAFLTAGFQLRAARQPSPVGGWPAGDVVHSVEIGGCACDFYPPTDARPGDLRDRFLAALGEAVACSGTVGFLAVRAERLAWTDRDLADPVRIDAAFAPDVGTPVRVRS